MLVDPCAGPTGVLVITWWHRLRGHRQRVIKVHGFGLWDFNPHGLFLRCSCGKDWAI